MENNQGNNQIVTSGEPQADFMVNTPNTTGPVPTIGSRPAPTGKSRKIIAGILVLSLLAIFVGTYFLMQNIFRSTANSQPASLPVLSQADVEAMGAKYGYDITYRPNVSPTEVFEFTTKYNLNSCINSTCKDAMVLYTDASLTQKVELTTSSSAISGETPKSYKVSVKPPLKRTAIETLKSSSDIDGDSKVVSTSISSDQRWGIAETYFLVQRVDEAGDPLTRPKVTMFTVSPDKQMLAATNLSAKIDENGSVNFSWGGSPGAKEYYIVKITRPADKNFEPQYDIVAKTDKTELNLAEYNGDKQRAEQAAKSATPDKLSEDQANFSQNLQMRDYTVKTEDSFYNTDTTTQTLPGGKYVPSEHGLSATSFAVVAVDGSSYSALREMDGKALLAKTPVGWAVNQSSTYYQQHKTSGANSNYDGLPMFDFVTMADGHTAKKIVMYDLENIAIGNTLPANDEAALPYKLSGTYIASSSNIWGPKGTYKKSDIAAKLKEINDRNVKGQPAIGEKEIAYEVKTSNDKLSLDTQKIPSDMPQVDYPVNGTSELVKFIAANILAGRYQMDIKNYYVDPTVSVQEAYAEAITQNPYINTVEDYLGNATLNGTILVVDVTMNKDEVMKRQQALLSQIKTVSAKIITSGMSDREKALAINKWLVENASYDYDAYDSYIASDKTNAAVAKIIEQYPYAWNALGTAVYTKGVCASYAHAFKAFADMTSLKAVYVTGTVISSGGRHAWNKVFMDGKWQIVDATWNDSVDNDPTIITKYFGLTDKQVDRIQDDDFVVKRFINDYAAN